MTRLPKSHRQTSGRRLSRLAPYIPIAIWIAVLGATSLITNGGLGIQGLLRHSLPAWLVLMWTIAVTLGAATAAAGALTLRSRIESSGLVMLLAGLLVIGSVGTYDERNWPDKASLLMFCSAFGAMCVIRMIVLARAREADKVADDIVLARSDRDTVQDARGEDE